MQRLDHRLSRSASDPLAVFSCPVDFENNAAYPFATSYAGVAVQGISSTGSVVITDGVEIKRVGSHGCV